MPAARAVQRESPGFYKRRCQEETPLLSRAELSARHRALVGMSMLPVRAWFEAFLIPVLVLHRLTLIRSWGYTSCVGCVATMVLS